MKHLRRLLLAGLTLSFVPTAFAAFSDIPSYHLYRDSIEYANKNGLAKGYEDGTFRPDQTVNRAEFFTLVDRFFLESAQPASPKPTFKDTNGTEWFFPAVEKAYGLKLIGGYPDGSLKPEKLVTFAEASKVLVRLAQPDLPEGATWFEPFVRALEAQKAIPLSLVAFDQPLSRGEVMEMLWRVKEKKTDQTSGTWEELRAGKARPQQFSVPKGYVLRPTWKGETNYYAKSMQQSTAADYTGYVVFSKDAYDDVIDELSRSVLGYFVSNVEDLYEANDETLPACAMQALQRLKKSIGESPMRDPYVHFATAGWEGSLQAPNMLDCDPSFDTEIQAYGKNFAIDLLPEFLMNGGNLLTHNGDMRLHDMDTSVMCTDENPVNCETGQMIDACKKTFANKPDAMLSDCEMPLQKLLKKLDTYVFINGYKMGPYRNVSQLLMGAHSASIFPATKDYKSAVVVLNGKEIGTYAAVTDFRPLPSGRSFSYVASGAKANMLMVNEKALLDCAKARSCVTTFVFDENEENIAYILSSDGHVRQIINGVPGEAFDSMYDGEFINGELSYRATRDGQQYLMLGTTVMAQWPENRANYLSVSPDGKYALGYLQLDPAKNAVTVYVNGKSTVIQQGFGISAGSTQWSADGSQVSFGLFDGSDTPKTVTLRAKDAVVLSIK